MSRPRIKVPKMARVGEIVEIKSMIGHKMESGRRKNKKTGKLIPRKIINALKVTFNGKPVFSATLHPSVSANPYFAFDFKVPGAGEMEFTWTEDGGRTITAKRSIKIA